MNLRWAILLSAGCAFLAPSVAFACDGAGAAEAIYSAERLGFVLWGVTLLAVAVCLVIIRLQTGSWHQLWLILLAISHPGWWMSARGGDCGRMRVDGSILMTALTILAGGFAYWQAHRARIQHS